jgi:GNAT superfamily N-acetyltransferase
MSVKTKIDPHNTLPDVELRLIGSPDDKHEDYEIILAPQTPAGRATLMKIGNTALGFRKIELQPGFKGKGIGMAAYSKAIDMAHDRELAFTNDDYFSGQAKAVWDKLVEKGVAQEIQPPEEIESGTDVYDGRFIIPPEHHQKQ